MKKLLLLIVPLLFLFWVGFADTWTFDFTKSQSTTQNSSYNAMKYKISWVSWNIINLYSITLDSANTCTQYIILNSSDSVIKTWNFMNITWLNVIDVNLTVWYFSILFASWWSRCRVPYLYQSAFSNYNQVNQEFIFPLWWTYSINPDPPTKPLYFYYLPQMVFSWTDPRLPTPTPLTIHYNWTTTSFTGTDIRLTNLFAPYTMSGSDIIFTPYVYRALFRSH